MAPLELAACRIDPQVTLLGSPRPRNDRVDSDTMALPTARVVLTNTSGSTDGRTGLTMTCPWPPPSALARSMYGRASTDRVWARTSRAPVGQDTTPMAVMMVMVPP